MRESALEQIEDSFDKIAPPTKQKRNRTKQPQNSLNLSISTPLVPFNEAQKQFIRSFKEGLNVLAVGSAGTGKSYLACHLALEKLFNKDIDKIVIIRSAVQTRQIGFTPGTEMEKALVYAMPYKSIINEICSCGTAWDTLHKKGMIEFTTTSFIRGITLKNCAVIFDEAQSANYHEISSVFTRIGDNAQLVVCGDIKQDDLKYTAKLSNDKTGLPDAVKVINNMSADWFDIVSFTSSDIVRSGFVKAWIIAEENTNL